MRNYIIRIKKIKLKKRDLYLHAKLQNLRRHTGLAIALVCFSLLSITGCSGAAPLYTAGLTEETAAADAANGSDDASDGIGTDTASADAGADSAGATATMAGADSETAGSSGTTDVDTDGESAGFSGTDVGTDRESADASGVNGTSESAGVSDTLAGLGSSSDETSTTETVIGYVYVCGAVKDPGVYPIRDDMRVCDAVELAGGFSDEADEEWLNQAATLRDGQKLYVYTIEETDLMKASGMAPEGMDGSITGTGTSDGADSSEAADAGTADGGAGEDSSSGTGTASDGKVNINTATREELMTLPGIGESKADAIVAYRDAHGAFSSIEEIQNISGIKSGVFSQIKDLITV